MWSVGTGLNPLSALLYASKMLFLICLTSKSAAETLKMCNGGKTSKKLFTEIVLPWSYANQHPLTRTLWEMDQQKNEDFKWTMMQLSSCLLMMMINSAYSRVRNKKLGLSQYCSAILYLSACLYFLLLVWLERWVLIKKKLMASMLCCVISERCSPCCLRIIGRFGLEGTLEGI